MCSLTAAAQVLVDSGFNVSVDTSTAFTTVATGLNLKQRHTMELNLYIVADTCDVYVDGRYKGVGGFTRVRIVIQRGRAVSYPSAAAVAATGIWHNSATRNGQITSDGGEACQCKFWCTEEGGESHTETSSTGSKRTGETFSHAITEPPWLARPCLRQQQDATSGPSRRGYGWLRGMEN